MERLAELTQLYRSLVMLSPHAPALDREQALALVQELQAAHRRLGDLAGPAPGPATGPVPGVKPPGS